MPLVGTRTCRLCGAAERIVRVDRKRVTVMMMNLS